MADRKPQFQRLRLLYSRLRRSNESFGGRSERGARIRAKLAKRAVLAAQKSFGFHCTACGQSCFITAEPKSVYKANGYKKSISFSYFFFCFGKKKYTVSFCAKRLRLPFSFGERKKRSGKEKHFFVTSTKMKIYIPFQYHELV